jgi:serine/threonine protein kinase
MAANPPYLDFISQAHPGLAILEHVRSGGQKSVWRATYAGQPYALKVVVSTTEASERTQREINILRDCRSPRIVRLGPFDLQQIEVGGTTYIYYLEEFVEGQAVDSVIKPLPLAVCRTLGIQLSEATEDLWRLRKVHRDIKPGNIIRRAGRDDFVLLDTGLALDLDGTSITATGNVVGTTLYLSPDQLKLVNSRRDLDFRSDLHAVGVVMYECLTGLHPLWNPHVPQVNIYGNILGLRPLPVQSFRADTPTSLQDIVLRLLEKEPHARYSRIRHLIEELEGVDLP